MRRSNRRSLKRKLQRPGWLACAAAEACTAVRVEPVVLISVSRLCASYALTSLISVTASVKDSLPPSTEADELASRDEPKLGSERRTAQANALQRLNGATSPRPESRSPAPPPASRPEPMSLAAFMGGRASGPRLNKHAPQADAHDPTQFEQRSHVSAPHPIFGRGGIAMPGMAGRNELGRSKAAVVSPPKPPPMKASVSTQPSPQRTTPR